MIYLLPNLLAEDLSPGDFLPVSVDAAVTTITALIAENEKEGRRFLRRFVVEPPKTFRDIPIHILNEHTSGEEKKKLFGEIRKGGIWGLISDCGMPCLADPGADIVLMAQNQGIPVKTFSGPSSILFALILSGLGGQHFTFHGYLPKEALERTSKLQKIEKCSRQEGSTHLFIETPYRNRNMLESILATLNDSTWLCIACDLTAPSQSVQTRRIADWKRAVFPERRPAVFVLRA